MNTFPTGGFITIIIIVVAVLGAWYWMATKTSSPMTLAQAVAVAQGSECSVKGTLLGTGTYNQNSETWWLDFIPKSNYAVSGCNPACVVYTASSSAEINWRCTGAIEP